MRLFKNKYRIESTRLKGWDYSSPGAYFVTIVTKNQDCYFGNIHGIIIINDPVKTQNISWIVETQNFASLPPPPSPPSSGNRFGPQSKNLASIVRGYKIGVTKYAKKNNIPFQWQSRYYDHIIRDEKSFNNIRQYIIQNPLNWQTDAENPIRTARGPRGCK